MILRPTDLAGCFVIVPEPAVDERGSFARTFDSEAFSAWGLNPVVSQVSVSRNHAAGTLRGLHYQEAPHAEAKLVRCTQGRVFDVAVDVATLRWTAVELSAANGLALYVPEGFAHGFLTLEPSSELVYQISRPYVPASSRGLRWDDPALDIAWPDVGPLTISERDRGLPLLGDEHRPDGRVPSP